jgi:DNA replication protein DnaC
MLQQPTLDKIRQFKLFGMLDALDRIQQNQSLQTLSFSEGLGLLIDQEAHYRENKRLVRLLKSAKLRYPNAMIEDINYEHKRVISSQQLKSITTGQWLINYNNLIFIGPTGIGKTFLACACAQLACRFGYQTRYYRLSKLLEALRIAHADGSYSRLLAQLLKTKCLVIDDWGIDAISPERRADLLEIIDDQYDNRSVIIASQLPIEHWHEYIGDHTIADAILDRIIHQATIFKLNGESMRKKLESC